MQYFLNILSISFLATVLFSCSSNQELNTVLPTNINNMIIQDFSAQSLLYKQLTVGDSSSQQKLSLSDSLLTSELSFLSQHFFISDKKLEGKWKKNTMVKGEQNIIEEFLGEEGNKFQSVIIKKRSANILELRIQSEANSIFGDTSYELFWKKRSKLQYTIQKEGHDPIQFTYCFTSSC